MEEPTLMDIQRIYGGTRKRTLSELADDPLIAPPKHAASLADWWERGVQNAAGSLASLVTLPGRAMQQGITTEEAIPWAANVGMGMVGTPATPAGALGSSIKPIRAYHGSPHDFDRFDLSKIGTGEGAQAYGHGLYFAENKATAADYRNRLSGPWSKAVDDELLRSASGDIPLTPEQIGTLRHFAADETLSPLDAAKRLQWRYSELRDPNQMSGSGGDLHRGLAAAIEQARTVGKGRMYEVNINAEPQQFLDWDKPLSAQPAQIQSAFGLTPERSTAYNQIQDRLFALQKEPGGLDSPEWNRLVSEAKSIREGAIDPNVPGQLAYYRMAGNKLQSPETSARLNEAGIPGIKYLDQGSRGAGTGTNNYVVFNDQLIDILRKYGIAAPAAGVGYSQMSDQQ